MATIKIYKYVLGGADRDVETVYRYTIPNLESMQIQYNTPISPMPLPEENVKENVLVKIEGNSGEVNIDWNLVKYAYTESQQPPENHFAVWKEGDNSETLPASYNDEGIRGKFNPVGLTFSDVPENSSNPEKQIDLFREYFESKSLDNDYLITIEDNDEDGYGIAARPTRFYGSPSQMSFSISGSSPVIWKARFTFLIGNVITVYDPDSPESPQDLNLTAVRTGTGNSTKHYIRVRFHDPSSFGGTTIYKVEGIMRQEGKLEWDTTEWGVTNSDVGESTTLKKISDSNNTDDGFYVFCLPSGAAGHDLVLDPNLAGSGGSNGFEEGTFDITAYEATLTRTNSGNDWTGGKSLKPETYYTVKVFFRNSAGDGGVTEDTVKTQADA